MTITMDVRRGNGHFLPPEIEIRDQKYLEILKINIFYFRNNWFNSCYDSLFAGMTLTLHKRQIHCSGVIQWWACSSLMSPLLSAKAGAKVANGLFYCWSLLRNKYMATNRPIRKYWIYWLKYLFSLSVCKCRTKK